MHFHRSSGLMQPQTHAAATSSRGHFTIGIAIKYRDMATGENLSMRFFPLGRHNLLPRTRSEKCPSERKKRRIQLRVSCRQVTRSAISFDQVAREIAFDFLSRHGGKSVTAPLAFRQQFCIDVNYCKLTANGSIGLN